MRSHASVKLTLITFQILCLSSFCLQGSTAWALQVSKIEHEDQISILDRKLIERQLRTEAEAARDRADRNFVIAGIVSGVLGVTMVACLLLFYRERLARARLELASKELRANEIANSSRKRRLNNLSLLAGGVAHDFNNLLVGVLSGAELLQMDVLSDEDRRECLSVIISSCGKASALSKQMLTYSGNRSTDRVACDLNALMDEASPKLKAKFIRSALKIEMHSQPVFTRLDQAQIEQVLLSLVDNAQNASSDADESIRITINISQIDPLPDKDATFILLPECCGDFGVIQVQDFGQGVPQETVSSLFDPFVTGFEAGRGLGLAVVYGIVAAHKGAIQVHSQPDPGFTIRVYFPLIMPEKEQS